MLKPIINKNFDPHYKLNSLRPQDPTELQWQSVPFIHDLKNGFVDISIKFPPTMQVRVADAQNLDADSTTKPVYQCLAGERVAAAPFQVSKPWCMMGRTSRKTGEAQPPIFGMSAKSTSGTGGDSEEERERGMATIVINVPDEEGAAEAGSAIDDAAQPSAAKRRKGVQSDLGDL